MNNVADTIANCDRHIRELSERIERLKDGEAGTAAVSRSQYIDTMETILDGWQCLRARLRGAEYDN